MPRLSIANAFVKASTDPAPIDVTIRVVLEPRAAKAATVSFTTRTEV
jgi:hypothetical protein